MAVFLAHEVARERRDGEPIIAPSLFANRAFSISLLTIMIAFMGRVGSMAFLPLYAQGVLRISATNSSLVLTPMLLALLTSSMIGALAGVLDAVKIGLAQSVHAVFLGGFAILVVGFVVVLFLPHIDIRAAAAGDSAETAPDAGRRSA